MNETVMAKWTTVMSVAFTGAWLRIPYTVQILILLMGLDILTSLFASIVRKNWDSGVFVRGLFTRFAAFPVLGTLHLFEKLFSLSFEFESFAAIAFIIWQAGSILEHASLAGLPVPSRIVTILAKAKIDTATPEEIHRQFSGSEQSTNDRKHVERDHQNPAIIT